MLCRMGNKIQPNSKILVVFIPGKKGGNTWELISYIMIPLLNGMGQFRYENSKFDKIMIILRIDGDADMFLSIQKLINGHHIKLEVCGVL